MSAAASRARQRKADKRRRAAAPRHVVDGADQVIQVGGHCGLHIDLGPDDEAPRRGDWIATEAGSRYLVDDVRPVRRRTPTHTRRYQMQCLRLPKHARPPADVHVVWLSWYPRGRRS